MKRLLGAALAGLVLSGCQQGQWQRHIAVDPITDQKNVAARLVDLEGNTFQLECNNTDAEIKAIVRTRVRMGGWREEENYVDRNMEYRFDDGQVVRSAASVGENFIGFVVRVAGRDRRTDQAIIQALPGHDKLALQVDDWNYRDHQFVWNVTGAASTLRWLRQQCGQPRT